MGFDGNGSGFGSQAEGLRSVGDGLAGVHSAGSFARAVLASAFPWAADFTRYSRASFLSCGTPSPLR